MTKLIYLLPVVLLAGFSACKKQAPPPSFHYNYYDVTPGRYVEYDVMEIVHDVTQSIPHDTSRYQLRTVIGDTVHDNEGRIARKYLRYTRPNASANWQIKDVWTTIIDQNRAELVEENQRVIKLVFAPSLSKEWNANAFNTNTALDCFYTNLHESMSLGALSFDSTLIVEQENFISFIDYRRKFEVYAKNVGLVKKYYKNLIINNYDTLNVKKGNELFYTCIGFGKN